MPTSASEYSSPASHGVSASAASMSARVLSNSATAARALGASMPRSIHSRLRWRFTGSRVSSMIASTSSGVLLSRMVWRCEAA